jgi:serine/threonine protein kinase
LFLFFSLDFNLLLLLEEEIHMLEPEIVLLLSSVLSALMYLDRYCIALKSLKAEDILITPEGQVKLGVVGFEQYYKHYKSRRSTVVGSLYWKAPEEIYGLNEEKASEIYALGKERSTLFSFDC